MAVGYFSPKKVYFLKSDREKGSFMCSVDSEEELNLPAVWVLLHTQHVVCVSKSLPRLEVCKMRTLPVTVCGEESLG